MDSISGDAIERDRKAERHWLICDIVFFSIGAAFIAVWQLFGLPQ